MLERALIKDFVLTRTTMSEVFTDFAKFQIDAAAKGDDEENDDEKPDQSNIPVTVQATGMSSKIDKEQKMDGLQGDMIQSEYLPPRQ